MVQINIFIKYSCTNNILFVANMTMMGNPPQMTMNNDAQKSLGVPPDMMMPFPFGMNLPSQGKYINVLIYVLFTNHYVY